MEKSKKNILITGGTGLIGTMLVEHFQKEGHTVSILARKPEEVKNVKAFYWDVAKQKIDKDCLTGVDTIIHLAGAGIADKAWTDERKKEIIDSRTKSIELIYKTIKENNAAVKTVVSTSAVGFYGDRADEVLTETSRPGTGFLPTSCIEWEDAVDEGKKLNLRVVKLRLGILLTRKGGALAQLEKPVKYYVGAPLGDGNQWVPWIHYKDLIQIFDEAVADETYNDVYNAVAPNAVTNKTFTKTLGEVLKRPTWPINVPKFIMKAIMGERAEIVLMSTNAIPKNLSDRNFNFKFPHLKEALQELYYEENRD